MSTEPTPDSSTPEPTPPPAQGTASTLTSTRRPGYPVVAWSLVGLLSVGLIAMSILLGVRTNQVANLERKLGLAKTDSPGLTLPDPSSPSQAAPRLTAEPTTGPQAEALMKLARRTPGDPMALGAPDAKVTLIEYADYRCPYCAKWSLQVLPALKKYVDAGQLRIEFRDLPLFGEESELAAAAARAAGTEGKFWEMSNAIWSLHTGQGHPTVTKDIVLKSAQAIGIKDMAAFEKKLTDPAVRQAIAVDVSEATKLGINGTPHFVVNSTRIPGALGPQEFTNLIDEYLRQK